MIPAFVVLSENVIVVQALIVGAAENTVPVDSVLLVNVCVAVESTTGSVLNIRMLDELTPSGRLLTLRCSLHTIVFDLPNLIVPEVGKGVALVV